MEGRNGVNLKVMFTFHPNNLEKSLVKFSGLIIYLQKVYNMYFILIENAYFRYYSFACLYNMILYDVMNIYIYI